MEYRTIRTENDISEELVRLYEDSFPIVERVPMVSLISGPEGTYRRLVAVIDRDELIGMYSVVFDLNMTFLFYLAVSEVHRNRGIGSTILDHIGSQYPHPVILNIESTADDMSPTDARMRRKRFYLRNGFTDTGRILHDEQGTFDVLSDGVMDEPGYLKLLDSLGGGACIMSDRRLESRHI